MKAAEGSANEKIMSTEEERVEFSIGYADHEREISLPSWM